MPFVPLAPPRQLPLIGTSIERPYMDWKVKAAKNAFEMAKDVAMFANHLGGTLLIGAQEQQAYLAAYVGLSREDAARVRTKYSKAVAQLCQSPPQLDFEEYEDPNSTAKRVVAINVWPSLNLVGVRVLGRPNPDGYGDDTFVYPVRSGVDAVYLEPSQLAMFMTPQVRRVAVLLSKIPPGTPIVVRLWSVTSTFAARVMVDDTDVVLEEVVEEENVVKLRRPNSQPMYRIALDCITTVYEDWDPNKNTTVWRLVVDYER